MPQRDAKRRAPSALGVAGILVVVILSGWVTEAQMTFTPLLREDRTNLERTIAGTADRPFCYRVLVPWVTAAVARLVPQELGEKVCAQPARWMVCRFMPPDPATRAPYFALAGLLFASILAYAVLIGSMYRRLFAGSELSRWLAAAGSLIVVLATVYAGCCGHIYDFTMLALFAGMVWTLLFERLRLFLVLFCISCWTKETTILVTFAYFAIYWDRLPRQRFLLHLAVQFVAFVAAYATVKWLYAHNPGGALEHWYGQEVTWLARKFVLKVSLLVSAAVAIGFKWRQKPLALRRALLMLAPHLALFIYAARPGELRNLYESFPIITLLVFRNLAIAPAAIRTALYERSHSRTAVGS
jgi:hypothetical protein